MFFVSVGLDDICDDQTATCTVQNSICSITFPRVCECTANYYDFFGSCQLSKCSGEDQQNIEKKHYDFTPVQ